MDMGFNARASYIKSIDLSCPCLLDIIFSSQPLYIPYRAKCPFVKGQRICKEAGNSYNDNMRHTHFCQP